MEITNLYAHSLEGANDRIISLGFFKTNPSSGGGNKIEGTNYIFVSGNGTPTENADRVLSAYNEAIEREPTASSRVVVVIAPGYYDFAGEPFKISENYVDVVSLTGNPDVYIQGGFSVTANNVIVRGINRGTSVFLIVGGGSSNMIIENCKGGDASFCDISSMTGDILGTFINCHGGIRSWSGTVRGTLMYCSGGYLSFKGDMGRIESTGRLYFCTMGGGGTFPTPESGGKVTYCIGSDGSPVNLG